MIKKYETRGHSIEKRIIIDKALLLIDKARQLEKDARALSPLCGGGEANREPSWRKLQQSAHKYKDVVSNLKNYARKISRQDSTGSDGSDVSAYKMEKDLNDKIKEYETKADVLLAEAEEMRVVEQQRQEQQLHQEKRQKSRQSNNTNLPVNYTPDEIDVLMRSSRIASAVFQPWIEEEVRAYDYSPDEPWDDPDCILKPLERSEDQKVRFFKWARPSEIISMRKNTPSQLSKITMIKTITPDTIRQCCVSDCSFIAGLCILAELERRFDRRLITSLIYPQDPGTGMPRYNEKGLYIVKLWFNGVEQRVLVDDKFPVDKDGKLLCSHTENKDGCLELWVPILEKAYMKLCGGYDFPGSNSGVDLFCLTGWIPERISFAECPDYVTRSERAWERLLNAYEVGACLATVSTSENLSEEEAEIMGLITGHAYAVLTIFMSSNGTRLLRLKNPWASTVIISRHFSVIPVSDQITNANRCSPYRESRDGMGDSHRTMSTAGVILRSAKKLDTMLVILQLRIMEFFGCRGMTSFSTYQKFMCHGILNCFNGARKSMVAGMQMWGPEAKVLSIQLLSRAM